MRVDEISQSPALLIMEEGVGDYVHGPEAVARIAAKVPHFIERAKK